MPGRNALVVGSGAVGAALAERLRADGADVALSAGADAASGGAVVRRVAEEPLDLVVLDPGDTRSGPSPAVPPGVFDRAVLDAHVLLPLVVLRAVLPVARARGRGAVLVVLPDGDDPDARAARAFVSTLVASLATAVAGSGVALTACHPAGGAPADVAGTALADLARGRCHSFATRRGWWRHTRHARRPLRWEAGRATTPWRAGRTALVTGASSGIGERFARRLAADGLHLVVVARDRARLDALAEELRRIRGVEVEVLVADLGDPAARAVVGRRLSAPGPDVRPVDLLVNNAGYATLGEFVDTAPEVLVANVEVNVAAVGELTAAALPGMRERGRGEVVAVSSVAGFLPGRGSVYGAGKAWVTEFSRSLARAGAGSPAPGVAVMALCPGYVRTEFHDRMGQGRTAPAPMWLDAERVVDAALADLAARKVVSVPGGLYRTIVAIARATPDALLRRAAARSASGRG